MRRAATITILGLIAGFGVMSFGLCGKSGLTSARPSSPCEVVPQLRALVVDPKRAKDCGRLKFDASLAELEASRACVLAAAREKRPFMLHRALRGIDSRVEQGIAGYAAAAGSADSSPGYKIYWISYDGCPSGCGDGDPHSRTQVCTDLLPQPDSSADAWDLGLTCSHAELASQCP